MGKICYYDHDYEKMKIIQQKKFTDKYQAYMINSLDDECNKVRSINYINSDKYKILVALNCKCDVTKFYMLDYIKNKDNKIKIINSIASSRYITYALQNYSFDETDILQMITKIKKKYNIHIMLNYLSYEENKFNVINNKLTNDKLKYEALVYLKNEKNKFNIINSFIDRQYIIMSLPYIFNLEYKWKLIQNIKNNYDNKFIIDIQLTEHDKLNFNIIKTMNEDMVYDTLIILKNQDYISFLIDIYFNNYRHDILNMVNKFENTKTILKLLKFIYKKEYIFDIISNLKDRNIMYEVLLKYNKFNFKIVLKNNVDICSICLNTYDTIFVKTSCNHLFHFNCIYKWLNDHKTCPYCVSDILINKLYKYSVIRLFNCNIIKQIN